PEAIDAWPTPAWSPPAGLTVLRVRVETTAGAHAAVSGAVVVLHAPGGASTRRAITDDDGECVYVLTGVPTLDGDGNVSLEAEVSGAAASVDAVRVAPTTTFTAGDALAVRPSTTSRVVLRVT
ncbi:MAG TPA: hypothetical protein PKA64_11605, partial [Myxococcota bacterium]|nr:hypothetical protein [Myxococcota bacterium]